MQFSQELTVLLLISYFYWEERFLEDNYFGNVLLFFILPRELSQ